MRFGFSGPKIGFFRPWVSFSVGGGRSRAAATARYGQQPDAEMIYVIRREDNGHHKIGLSVDPIQRRNELQTGSSTPLTIVWTTPVFGSAYDVEQEAHAILRRHRQIGEWFDVPREAAVGAIYGAASRLGVPLDQSFREQNEAPMQHRLLRGVLVFCCLWIFFWCIGQFGNATR